MSKIKFISPFLLSMALVSTSTGLIGQVPAQSVPASLIATNEKPNGFDPIGFLIQSGKFPAKHDFKISVQWLKDGLIERIEPETLFQGDQFELNGDGPLPGVFVKEVSRYLVWGSKGWAWAINQPPWEYIPFSLAIDQAISKANVELQKQTNNEGWTLHRGWLFEVSRSMVMSQSTAASSPLAPSYPPMMEGEAHFDSHGQYLAEGNPAPSSKTLIWENYPKTRSAILALPIKRNGDWVKVLLPVTRSSAIKVLFWGVPGDDDPAILVRWDPKAVGWLRWRCKGTLQGTSRFQKDLRFSYWGFQ